jgi:CubicO group peptidase (beta-lactamase class C family)
MRLLISLLLLTLFLPVATHAQKKDSIDLFIADQMEQQGITGLSIGIVKNGKVIKAMGYGLANIELNVLASEKTVYKIASISKHLVATGIMKLEQDGKLKVSDPITKFINGAPSSWSSITIRHLLNQYPPDELHICI